MSGSRGLAARRRGIVSMLTIGASLAACGAPSSPRTTAATAPSFPAPAPPEHRLSDAVQPVRVDLSLALDPEQDDYEGTTVVDLRVGAPVQQLWLHARVDVTSATVSVGARSVGARVATASEGKLGILLAAPIGPGPARLELGFRGKIDRARSRGIYGQPEDGRAHLYTFFEAIDARRAFPCFDEPGFKVPWSLSLTVPAADVAVANAPALREEPVAGGRKRVVFAATHPLPSYLVAFAVGPFDVVASGTIGRPKVPLAFVVPAGRGGDTAYARAVTPKLVAALEDYFDQDYPYEKLDVAVVPRFWGTMEHPGIVALGQPLTLIPPESATQARRQRYANIAVHELAHYWFGDLVTMAWWDDVWLNESLASYLDRKATQAVTPEWSAEDRLRLRSREAALQNDALPSASPVQKRIERDGDIESAFDGDTTYAKGSSVLYMLEGMLGEPKLRDVMRAHVRRHVHGVAGAGDFLATLREVGGADAAAVMRAFVERPGAPRVTAELACTAQGAVARLAQERHAPKDATLPGDASPWPLPVCVRALPGGARTCTLLRGARGEVALPGPCPRALLLNAGGLGYYRSGYPLRALTAVLQDRGLSPAERAVTLGDAHAAVLRGDLALADALAFVPETAGGADAVAEAGLELLHEVRADRLSPAGQEAMLRWVRRAYGPRAQRLGLASRPGESEATALARELVVPTALDLGEEPALVAEAGRRIRGWLADRRSSADVLEVGLRAAARAGDAALFDAVLSAARETRDVSSRDRLMYGLGSFRDPRLSDRALALVASGELDLRDASAIWRRSLWERTSRERAWAFLRARFDQLAPRMRADEIGGVIGATRAFCDEAHASEVEAFFGERLARLPGAELFLRKAVDGVRACARVQDREASSVDAFFQRSTPRRSSAPELAVP